MCKMPYILYRNLWLISNLIPKRFCFLLYYNILKQNQSSPSTDVNSGKTSAQDVFHINSNIDRWIPLRNCHVIKVDLFSSKIIAIAMIYFRVRSWDPELCQETMLPCYLYIYVAHTCSKKILLAKACRNNSTELLIFNSSCQNIKLFK